MLAEITATGGATIVVCGILSTLLTGGMFVIALRSNTRRDVSLVDNYATTGQLGEVRDEVKRIDGDVRKLREDINTNGEMRKNHMLGVIEDRYERLDTKIDTHTTQLRKEIADSTKEQTRQLIVALKGKND